MLSNNAIQEISAVSKFAGKTDNSIGAMKIGRQGVQPRRKKMRNLADRFIIIGHKSP